MTGEAPKRRRRRGRKPDTDPAFAEVVAGFAHALRRMILAIPPPDEPLDEGGLAGSRIPRRPPDKSGSGSVALIEPRDDIADES